MEGDATSNETDAKMELAKEALMRFGYNPVDVSAEEFHDYMTGEIFSDDPTTLRDVLANEYIMIHELVEIGELKRIGRRIAKNTARPEPASASQ